MFFGPETFLDVLHMYILRFAYPITPPYTVFQGTTVEKVMGGAESPPPLQNRVNHFDEKKNFYPRASPVSVPFMYFDDNKNYVLRLSHISGFILHLNHSPIHVNFNVGLINTKEVECPVQKQVS